MNNLCVNIPSFEDVKFVYHYTSVEGFKSILENKKLWFSGIQYMNDASEMLEASNCCKEYFIQKHGDEETPVIKEYLDKQYEELFEKEKKKNIFVCCFSLGNDELPIWNYYCKDNKVQGYNLAFKLSELIDNLLRNNWENLSKCDISYGIVQYDKEKAMQLYDNMLKYSLTKYKEDFEKAFVFLFDEYAKIDGIKDVKKLEKIEKEYNLQVASFIKDNQCNNAIAAPIYSFDKGTMAFSLSPINDPIFYIKNQTFASEKEVRICITVPDDVLKKMKEDGIYKFRNFNGILIPYLDLKFEDSCIQGVTISPTLKDDMVTSGVSSFLDYCGFDINKMEYGIQKSQIPLRY